MNTVIHNYIAYELAGAWPIIWHFGLAGILIAGFLAAAYFSPFFKKDFVYAAVVVAVFSIAVSVGVSLGEKRVQAQWDEARANAVEAGKKAHDGAVSDVARKPSRWLPAHKDKFNRD